LFLKHSKSIGKFDEDMIANLANPDLPFGMFVDLICFSISPSTEFLRDILETSDTWERCKKLMKQMDHEPPRDEKTGPEFPPNFSAN